MKKKTRLIFLFAILVLVLAVGLWFERRSYYDTVDPEELARVVVNEVIPNPLGWFYEHMGRYPTTEEGLAALFVSPTTGRELWRGPYIEGKRPILDPWGNPYQYRWPGERNPDTYDLYSLGTSETGPIGNWQKSNKSEMPTP